MLKFGTRCTRSLKRRTNATTRCFWDFWRSKEDPAPPAAPQAKQTNHDHDALLDSMEATNQKILEELKNQTKLMRALSKFLGANPKTKPLVSLKGKWQFVSPTFPIPSDFDQYGTFGFLTEKMSKVMHSDNFPREYFFFDSVSDVEISNCSFLDASTSPLFATTVPHKLASRAGSNDTVIPNGLTQNLFQEHTAGKHNGFTQKKLQEPKAGKRNGFTQKKLQEHKPGEHRSNSCSTVRTQPRGGQGTWGVEGQLEAPLWSIDRTNFKVREHLSQIVFHPEGEQTRHAEMSEDQGNGGEIATLSGRYELKIRYDELHDDVKIKAGIIIGEIEFDNRGYALAEGADWDRLLGGYAQVSLPYGNKARGSAMWHRRKISEPWNDGDILTFGIDTDRNTLRLQRGDTKPKLLRNVLSFSNNRKYPDFLRIFAYCGSSQLRLCWDSATLTIVDD